LKKHLVRFALGLVIVLVFLAHAADWYELPLVKRLEAITYDARLRLTMPGGVDPRIVIVDIDERSLAVEGHWPWPRDRLALFLDRLFDDYKARVVGFDVVFAEKDDSSGLKVLERLAQTELKSDPQYLGALQSVRPQLEYDRMFGDRMRGRNVVLGFYLAPDRPEGVPKVGRLPPPVLPPGVFQGRNIDVPIFAGYGANLPELQGNAASAGTSIRFQTWMGSTAACPCWPSMPAPITSPCLSPWFACSWARPRSSQGSPGAPAGRRTTLGWSGWRWRQSESRSTGR
jgi:adenylate cyclase